MPKLMNRLNIIPFLVFGAVVVLDQISKYCILLTLAPGQEIGIVPHFFNLVLTFNQGIAFGLFRDLPTVWRNLFLGSAMSAALVVLLYLFVRDYRTDLLSRSAIASILGGAIGNIIDRFQIGMVVDFLDFYWGSYHWPAFNVADSAVCVGVIILLFRPPRRD